VKRLVRSWIVFTVVASLGLLLARFFGPGRFELELDIYILAVGGLAVLEVVVATREAYPREGRSALATALEPEATATPRPADLERLERELTMATSSAFDLHSRLRPLVREIAAMRLATRGVALDEAEDEVGEEIWDLVRTDRPAPIDRHAPGIDPVELRRVVERLEAL
jgi:hypothetical protein